MSATPNFTSYITYPGSFLQPSLLDLKITSSSILNPQSASGGTLYDAWCMVETIDLPVPASYTSALYSSYEIGTLVASVPTLANNKFLANLDNINWLLNWYNGTNAAYGDVQGAIWKMLGSDAIVDYVGPQNAATIDALVAEALKHDGYVPDIGGTIAAVVDPLQGSTHRQPLLVTMQAASIGDKVWHDANANGIQDAGEAGIANATVQLVRDQNQDGDFNDANEVLATTTTDSQGNYVFKGLTPGLNYQVVFSLPSGYEVVSPRQADGKAAGTGNSDALVSNIVVLAPGENNNTIDAGFYNKASLGDRLWLDANGNGQQDAGEAGIAGQTVTLLGGGKDGLISTAADNTTITTTTDANGNYKFTGLTPGVEYQVQFSAPAGSVFTAQDKGADASDSDVGANGLSQIVKLSSGENNVTIDAGVYVPASLGDRLWVDANGNGQQDSGETGIAGATVTLIGGGADGLVSTTADNTTVTTTTDANGNYKFTGLTPGVEYQVQFAAPAGTVFTAQDKGNDASDSDVGANGLSQIVKLSSGENNVTIDAGVYVPASLGDRLWVDANGNGQQDSGETGIAGATVTLIGGGADGLVSTTADNTTVTTTTDANGNYKFSGLTPGVEYQVQFAAPADTVFTAQDKGDDASDSDVNSAGLSQIVKLSSGENNATIDAGVYVPASLGDRVWVDANGNGQQDSGEAGVAGATVTLIGGGTDGLISTTADNTSITTTTDVNGNYKFTGLTPGVEYQVQFAAPTGSVFTAQDKGNDASDSDADAMTGKSQIVTLTSGENNTSIDAGIYNPASLGDRVWVDTNGNGQQDSGETGVGGATVTLIGGGADGLLSTTADNTSVTTTTDANGTYKFTGLTPGVEYQVQFAAPAGSVFTAQDKGSDASDSDAGVNGLSQIVKLVSGENNTSIDAGIYNPASLGDRVWVDANGNGQQDSGETGVGGATVTLIGGGADGLLSTTADNTSVTTTTDANGNYKFNGLTPGVEYQVQFTAPDGSVFTAQDKGNDASDSDANAKGLSQIVKLASGENNTSIDAGIYTPASLGDRLWTDANGNGQQDSGEAGVAGATVTLISGGADGLISTTADNTSVTTTTDANGNYKFTGLTPGVEYQVQFAAPAGSVFTAQDKGDDASDSDANAKGLSQIVKLASGENNTTVDAGVYTPATLGDRVWVDANGNGQQDSGETGVAGATVTLIGGGADGLISTTADNTTVTTTTDANGNYKFTGLTPGIEYQVQFAAPAGSVFTAQDKGDDAADSDVNSKGLSQIVKLASGENNTSIDAGMYTPATLGDRVWVDANGNGQQDSGETGVGGATVTLIGGGADGLLSTTADNTSVTTTTDANGNYKFNGLTPGVEYQVQFAAPAGSVFTAQDKGDDASDSDANAKGLSQIVKLASGENNTTIDAGVYTPATLGDRVWVDANGNGQQDSGETGVAGATVTLIGGGADGLISTTADNTTVTMTTDANGNYKFTGLTPGVEYQVQFAAPEGTVFTAQDKGDDASDSDANAKGLSQIVKLASGENNTSIDAGVYTPASLGDRVWTDANGNGQQDSGEAGVAGATVTLIGGGADGLLSTTADNTSVTTTTDANGNYKFTGLTPGIEYQVQFAAPAGTVFTAQDKGDDASDSDANAKGLSQIVKLASGENNTSIDAGVYTPASLGDRVWTDANGNGQQDNGEAGVAGATVTLIGGGADGLLSTTADNTSTTTTTDANGNYKFAGLTPGVEYQVQFAAPTGTVFTAQDKGDDASDSDANAKGLSQIVKLASGENNTSIDAGVYTPATLGDRVWTDANGNGQQDNGEAGVAGATVTLIGGGADGLLSTTADNTTVTTTTDANGNYKFTGLTPGVEYQVQFAAPTGTVFTAQDKGSDASDSDADATTGKTQIVKLASGENNTSIDAGVYTPATLGDRVWVDANGNGQQDANETGVANATVTLISGGADGLISTAADNTTVTTTTDANGNYKFTGLTPGVEYQVQFAAPAGTVFTAQDKGDDASDSDASAKGLSQIVKLASGENNTSIDAGVYTPASLGDRLWTDANANGQQDANETGVANATVTLIGGGADGLISTTADNTTVTTTTDANGNYKFTGLTPGMEYQVQFAAPAGTVFTAQDKGDDASDSDVNATTGKSQIVKLASGENNTSIDAGVYATASLGDRFWVDANANGQQDSNETGVANATVTLIGGGADGLISTTADNTTVTTTTDANGNYKFTGLTPGMEYQVQFAAPAGSVFTAQDKGDDASDSDVNATTGKSQIVKLASGENNTSIDAGVYATASLGDRVWADANGNGIQDAGEANVAGVVVNLVNADGKIIATRTTGSDGLYLFDNLAPGSYRADFDLSTLPSGYVVTTKNAAGSTTLNDSDADPLTGRTGYVTLASGTANRSVDLGIKAGAVGISIQTLEHGEYVVNSSSSRAEGLTPGFWKNHTGTGGASLSGWPETGLSPDASYEALFGVDVPGGAPTLLQALSMEGGGMEALLRHSAAALLNAANPYLNYVYDQAQVIALVRAAFASGNYDATKDLLAAQNQLEGSLTDLAPTGATFVTADLDANTAGSGTAIPVGGTAVFTYIVKNTGTVALGNVSVTDPRIASLTYVSGDTNRDGKLDVNETWTYKGSEVVSATGSYVHTGTATAKDMISGVSVSASDAANYSSTVTVQSLGDRVWLDSNANGVQDAGELGVAGVTVQLKSTSGTVLQTTTTDANGKYLFNVAAGSYTVTVQTPAGYSVSPKNVGDDSTNSDIDATTKTTGTITVGIGEQNLKADAGIYQTASLGNRVWIDANGNGQQDAGETGMSGLTVTLTGGGADGLISTTADNTTVTTTTGTDGAYAFSGLKPGVEYQVQFSKPTGYNYTVADTGSDLTDSDANVSTGKSQIVKLASGENNTGIDAGLVPAVVAKGSIGDLVWEDLNYNGVQDAGESGIANVTVRLLDGSNNVLATTVTNSSGNYLFSNLNAGSYKVQVVQPTGYLVTKAIAGTNSAADSNIDAATATSGTIVLAQGQNDTSVDAGLYRKASIGDKVWGDMNRNGIQDIGESGIQGVKVMLYSATGTLLSTTTTDASGNYKFINLDPGSYYLAFDKTNVVAGGYNLNSLPWSSKMIGTNTAVDSNVTGDGVSTTNLAKTDVTTLTSGENDMSWDAGVTPIAIDLNGDGVHTVARSVSVASGASFDLLGNGSAITSGWLSSSDGFLAVDLNGNGKIDSINELFGGSAKGDGFAKLASYDSNGDGVVDLHDEAFASLVIWRDANGNHATDAGELMTLAEAGVTSLTVSHTDLPFVDAQGNLHLERSSVTLANGTVADMTDVYFAVDAKDAPNAATFADLIGGAEPVVHVQVGLVGQAPVPVI